MRYNIDMSVKQLLQEPDCRRILAEKLPDVVPMLQNQSMAQGLSLRKLGQYLPQVFTPQVLEELDAELAKNSPPEGTMSRLEQDRVERYQKMAREAVPESLRGTPSAGSLKNGMPWFDTEGKQIQAHAGALLFENGLYYWYGENKEKTMGNSDVWTWGIRAYISRDLCSWKDAGLIIPPVLDDPDSSLFPDKKVDRPHIFRCPQTGKYICWLKLSGKEAYFTVLQADRFLGPYEIVRDRYRPSGLEVGDFDVVIEKETGKVYLFMDGNHNGVYAFRLSADCTACEKIVGCHYRDLKPPFTREGVTLFERNGRKYLLTSGMTGYIPNQSEVAVSDSWEGNFVSLGDPHPDDPSQTSFNSQISQIIQLPGSGRYLSLADRWLSDRLLDRKDAEAIRLAVASSTDPGHYSVTKEQQEIFRKMPVTEETSTAVSQYIWLPVEFDREKTVIRWEKEWKPVI